jgi:hypothetical protein
MSQVFRRVVPVIAICMATLLGGCVVVPENRCCWGPGWGWHHHY